MIHGSNHFSSRNDLHVLCREERGLTGRMSLPKSRTQWEVPDLAGEQKCKPTRVTELELSPYCPFRLTCYWISRSTYLPRIISTNRLECRQHLLNFNEIQSLMSRSIASSAIFKKGWAWWLVGCVILLLA